MMSAIHKTLILQTLQKAYYEKDVKMA